MGRELVWLAESCGRRVEAFIDDAPSDHQVYGIPVLTLEEAATRYPAAAFVCSLGASGLRRAAADRAIGAGLQFDSLVHPDVPRSRWVSIGAGAVIAVGTILTVDVRIGENVQINTGCTIAHDVVIERDATLAPGIHVSGSVIIREGAQIGTGASIINGTRTAPLVIGPHVVVGAGACVTRSVDHHLTVVGVPARPVERSREGTET